ncbi:MAG: cell division protein FtsL [Pseudomonadota bacterium]
MSKPASLTTLAALSALVMASALWVVHNKQTHRRLTTERDQLRAAHSQLEQEWSQLQLEEAALASHVRVERAARERWGMADPALPVVIQSAEQPALSVASEGRGVEGP